MVEKQGTTSYYKQKKKCWTKSSPEATARPPGLSGRLQKTATPKDERSEKVEFGPRGWSPWKPLGFLTIDFGDVSKTWSFDGDHPFLERFLGGPHTNRGNLRMAMGTTLWSGIYIKPILIRNLRRSRGDHPVFTK